MQTITSVKNPLIKSLKALSRRQERESAGRILVEGEVMIREALKCGLMLKDVLCVERKADFAAGLSGEAILVPEEVMQAVCDTRTPQGVCASFQAPAPRKAEELPNPVVALDGVQDPGNAGTIWRTADAAGVGGLLMSAACADPFSPKVQRAAMGSGFRVGVWMGELPAALRALQAQARAMETAAAAQTREAGLLALGRFGGLVLCQVDDPVIADLYLLQISGLHGVQKVGIGGFRILAVGNGVEDPTENQHQRQRDDQGCPDITRLILFRRIAILRVIGVVSILIHVFCLPERTCVPLFSAPE